MRCGSVYIAKANRLHKTHKHPVVQTLVIVLEAVLDHSLAQDALYLQIRSDTVRLFTLRRNEEEAQWDDIIVSCSSHCSTIVLKALRSGLLMFKP